MPDEAPRWLLALIALPAFVAIWSGWVSLAGMCGFGEVQPFPGIVTGSSAAGLELRRC